MYVITCPNCSSKELQQPDYNTFYCNEYKDEFDINEAETEYSNE